MERNNSSITQSLEIPSFAPPKRSAWGKCPRRPALGTALPPGKISADAYVLKYKIYIEIADVNFNNLDSIAATRKG